MNFNPALWTMLDELYEQEWESHIRPICIPDTEFQWKYVVFDGDKCISCPLVWTATKTLIIIGLQLKLENGFTFFSNEISPINMINGDSLTLDHLVIARK